MNLSTQKQWTVKIDGQVFHIDDPVVTGRQLLILAGMTAVEEHLIYLLDADGILEDIGLEETVDLRSRGVEKLMTFRSDRSFRFEIDGVRQDWGASQVSEPTLRKLAGVNRNHRVYFERQDEADQLLDVGELIELDGAGVERFYTKWVVTIIVNGREKIVTQELLTFKELIALAFDPLPTGANICFTVKYRRGGGDNPKGSLVEGDQITLKNGMIFNVTSTDKS